MNHRRRQPLSSSVMSLAVETRWLRVAGGELTYGVACCCCFYIGCRWVGWWLGSVDTSRLGILIQYGGSTAWR